MAVEPFLGTRAQKAFIATSQSVPEVFNVSLTDPIVHLPRILSCDSLVCAITLLDAGAEPFIYSEAIIVLSMVAITFGIVRQGFIVLPSTNLSFL